MSMIDGVGGVTSTPGTGTDVAARNRDLFMQVSAMLNDAGLGELFTLGADGLPGGWLWGQIIGGLDSQSALQTALEATPQFQARYPVIAEARQRAARGEPVQVPTVNQVRSYEVTVATTLRNAGLPTWFYDQPSDMQTLMGKGISAAEVEQRLGQAWTRVRNTDPAVLDTFREFYGIDGDGAMAAMFLDPAKTVDSLDRASMTAYTAGMGKTMGLNLDRTIAERVAALPKTEGGIVQDLQQVSQMNSAGGLFSESIGESANLTAETTGIGAVALGEGQAQADLQRRLAERGANSMSSTGGAATTQRGITGVGSA